MNEFYTDEALLVHCYYFEDFKNIINIRVKNLVLDKKLGLETLMKKCR